MMINKIGLESGAEKIQELLCFFKTATKTHFGSLFFDNLIIRKGDSSRLCRLEQVPLSILGIESQN